MTRPHCTDETTRPRPFCGPPTLRRAGAGAGGLLAVALLVLAVPSGGAAELWNDPVGDVEVNVYGEAVPAPGEWGRSDLVGLELVEEDDRLRLVLRTDEPGEFSARTEFRFEQRPYALEWGVAEAPYARLVEVTEVGDAMVADLDVLLDGGLVAELPRVFLRDDAGAAPRAGSVLEGFRTEAQAVWLDGPDPEQGFFCCTVAASVEDAAGNGTYTVTQGGRSGGDALRIGSPLPFRAHNGGQARFVFDVAVEGTPGRNVTLSHTDVPTGWTVEHPTWPLRVPDDGRRMTQVMVEVPSGHVHGGAASFRLEATDGNASAWTELGVHHLRVAQPTEHHRTLWIHSRAEPGPTADLFRTAGYASGVAYMNTLLDDPGDQGMPVDSTESGFGGTTSNWSVCLDPGLLVGLHLDDNVTGTLEAVVRADRPHGSLTFDARVSHFGPGPSAGCDAAALREERTETVLATATPQTGEPGPFALELATARSEPIPFADGAALLLELEVSYEVPDSQAPGTLVLEGGSLFLPWLEVADETPEWRLEEPVQTVAPEGTPDPTPSRGSGSPLVAAGVLAVGAVAWWKKR